MSTTRLKRPVITEEWWSGTITEVANGDALVDISSLFGEKLGEGWSCNRYKLNISPDSKIQVGDCIRVMIEILKKDVCSGCSEEFGTNELTEVDEDRYCPHCTDAIEEW